jgi:hypothetical protein
MLALNQARHDVFVPSHSLLEMFVRVRLCMRGNDRRAVLLFGTLT